MSCHQYTRTKQQQPSRHGCCRAPPNVQKKMKEVDVDADGGKGRGERRRVPEDTFCCHPPLVDGCQQYTVRRLSFTHRMNILFASIGRVHIVKCDRARTRTLHSLCINRRDTQNQFRMLILSLQNSINFSVAASSSSFYGYDDDEQSIALTNERTIYRRLQTEDCGAQSRATNRRNVEAMASVQYCARNSPIVNFVCTISVICVSFWLHGSHELFSTYAGRERDRGEMIDERTNGAQMEIFTRTRAPH